MSDEQPKEVTLVAHDIGPIGGMERMLAELITGLFARGYKITVIARTCELPAGVDVTFRRVPGPARPVLVAYPWFLAAGSLILRRWRRGIVQATGAIVFNQVDVVNVHYCHQVGPANPSRATAIFRLHARLVNLVARAAERWCFRLQRAAVFACVSNGVAGEVRSFYPRLASRVITIHNGVDTEHFAPAPAGAAPAPRGPRSALDGDRLSALFVGGEWEGKGLRPLLEALKLAPGWDLLVAGRGDRERYEQLARRLGVASAVHWLGVAGDVRSLYRRADAFVLPSTYETFSLVTFEAAACGLPVLVTPVSGVSELIVDGENGFFITREPETIALRLRELGADAGLCERLGRGARAAALRFSSQRMVECYDRLFSQIAAPAGQAPEAVRSAAQAGGAVA